MGSGLAGPLLFWLDEGMSEVRKFEMLAVPQVRSLGWRVYLAVGAVWFLSGFGLDLYSEGLTWKNGLFVGFLVFALIWDWRARRRPTKWMELSEERLRGPVGGKQWVEIPRASVEEIAPIAEGLLVAWKQDGVSRYTEVMEYWCSEAEWERARGALMEWGNRRDGAVRGDI
jgi:hypothetical protein